MMGRFCFLIALLAVREEQEPRRWLRWGALVGLVILAVLYAAGAGALLWQLVAWAPWDVAAVLAGLLAALLLRRGQDGAWHVGPV